MKKRIISLLLSIVMLLSMLIVFALPTSAKSSVNSASILGSYKAVRFYGLTRYETSVSIAEAFFISNYGTSGSFDSVVLASGADFPDALSGSYLAIKNKAPIIMINPNSKSANDYTISYIKTFLKDGGTVYVLGGTSAVPNSSIKVLKENYKVVRIGGGERFETNINILKKTVKNGSIGDDLIVCSGRGYADALSASAVGKPIFLVDQNTGELTDAQIEFLKTQNFKNIYIIGGKVAVPKSIEKKIKSICKDAIFTRIEGQNRYETSIAVANQFFESPSKMTIASGENFPDGLCGGPLSNSLGAPIILTTESMKSLANKYVTDNSVSRVMVLGGSSVLSDSLVKGIKKTGTILDQYYSFSNTGNFKSAQTPASVEKFINSAPLNPMKTNDAELDAMVDKLFSKLFTSGMKPYDKLLAVYKYLVKNYTYGYLATNVENENVYVSNRDATIIFRAKNFLKGKVGVCDDFSCAFMVMARRLGFQCYYVGGTYNGGGHAWNVIVINNQDYLFDSEADFRCSEGKDITTTYMFCRTERLDKYESTNYAYYVHNFNGFIIDKTKS